MKIAEFIKKISEELPESYSENLNVRFSFPVSIHHSYESNNDAEFIDIYSGTVEFCVDIQEIKNEN